MSALQLNMRKTSPFAWLLVAPVVALVLLVSVYPLYYAIQFSFYDSIAFVRTDYVGLDNYRRLFRSEVLNSIAVSFTFVVGSTLLAIAFGLGLALLLNGRIALRTTFRTIIFIPWVVSEIAAALTWRWLLNPDYGPLVYGLGQAGLPRIDFLGDAGLAMLVLIATNVWRSVAFSMIILIAALQGIPENILRAARVDGAGKFRVFCRIVLPILMPSIVVCAILSSFSYFNVVTIPLVLTGGGPADATNTLTLLMYKHGFSYFNVGFASALTILILLLNVMLTLAYLRVPHERV